MAGWLWWGWKGEQKAIEELRGAEAQSVTRAGRLIIQTAPLSLPVIPRLLPERWAYLLDRVRLLDSTFSATDQDLARIAGFSRLNHLSLWEATVTDEGLAALAKAKDLRLLGIGCAGIHGPGLRHLSGLGELQVLHLGTNSPGAEFDGQSLAYLAPLRNLTHLDLSGLRLRDGDLAPLAGLHSLQWLDLSSTGISEEGLVHLRGLGPLQLALRGMVLTDRGASRLAGLSALQGLSVDADRLRVGEAGIAQLRGLGNLYEVQVVVRNGFSVLSPQDIHRAFPHANIGYLGGRPTTWPSTLPASLAPATAPAPDR